MYYYYSDMTDFILNSLYDKLNNIVDYMIENNINTTQKSIEQQLSKNGIYNDIYSLIDDYVYNTTDILKLCTGLILSYGKSTDDFEGMCNIYAQTNIVDPYTLSFAYLNRIYLKEYTKLYDDINKYISYHVAENINQ